MLQSYFILIICQHPTKFGYSYYPVPAAGSLFYIYPVDGIFICGISQPSWYLSIAFVPQVLGWYQSGVTATTPVRITFISIHESGYPIFLTQYF